MIRLIIILLLLSSAGAASVKKNNYSISSSIASRYDRAAAQALNDFINNLEHDKLNKKSALSLHRKLKKSLGFRHLRSLSLQAIKISKTGRSLRKFYRACRLPKKKNRTFIYRTLESKLRSLCAEKFLTLLQSNKRITRLKKREKRFLQKYLNHYLSETPDLMATLINSAKKRHQRLYKQLSLLISQEYISSGIFPDSDIISLIDINEDFLLYLEQIGINDLETQKYLSSEFKRLKYALKKSLRRNDYEAAKTLAGHLLSFHSQNYRYLSSKTSWQTFLNAGKKLITSNNFFEGMQCLNYASKIAPSSAQDTIVFFLLWGNLIEKKYQNSLKIVHKHNLIERFNHLDSRLKYWVCHTLLKADEEYLAKHLMRKITSENPMDFYSIVALRELSQLYAVKPEATFLKTIRTPASVAIPRYKQFTSIYQNALRRLDSWLQLGSHKYSQQEIGYIFSSNTKSFLPKKYSLNDKCPADCVIARHLAKYFTSEGEYLHAFKIINKTLIDNSIDHNIITQLFPTIYQESIQKITDSLDPSLVLALIRQESAFNPKARSIVGARGLMQLMPTTAKQLEKSVKTSELTDPNVNMKLGIQYLTSLAKKYDGNLIYTLAAYNAGPTRIRYWMEHVFSTDNPLLMIESIPFKETRQYVKLIYRNIFFYKFLNNEMDLSIPVKDSFKIKLTSRR